MSFSENLQAIRKKNQLSQEELAELLGVSRQAISKWELGEGYNVQGISSHPITRRPQLVRG